MVSVGSGGPESDPRARRVDQHSCAEERVAGYDVVAVVQGGVLDLLSVERRWQPLSSTATSKCKPDRWLSLGSTKPDFEVLPTRTDCPDWRRAPFPFDGPDFTSSRRIMLNPLVALASVCAWPST